MNQQKQLSRGDKEGKKITTRYHETEADIINKIAKTMRIDSSNFQRLWTMFGVHLCRQLEAEGELNKFFIHGSFITFRSTIHRPFLDGSLPKPTSDFFALLMDEFEKSLKGGNGNGHK